MQTMKNPEPHIEVLETQLTEAHAELALMRVRLKAAQALKQEAFERLKECEAKTRDLQANQSRENDWPD